MPNENIIHTISPQAKTVIYVSDGAIFIEQTDEQLGTNDCVMIAPSNVDALIEALQRAMQTALAEGL